MASKKEFYQLVDVTFEGTIEGMGKIADGYKKWLFDLLDDIAQRLPDDIMMPKNIHIYFSTLEKIIERWEDPENPNRDRVEPRYLESIKRADKQWKNLAGIIKNPKDLFEAWSEMPNFENGCSTPTFRNVDGLLIIGCIIDIVIDFRTMYRHPDYVKGVICHEIAEFTTKWNVLQEHKREIKKIADVKNVLRKYLKSGYLPPSKEYAEHEEIVNREAKRLGFEKEIAVMEKHEFIRYNFK